MNTKKRPVTKNEVGRKCPYCRRIMLSHKHGEESPEAKGRVATIEHITPQGDGGTNEAHNLMIVCQRDNNLRGSVDYQIFCEFARVVIQQYPDAPTAYLRASLIKFVNLLARIAISNRREANKALSVTLLDFADRMKKIGE